LQIERRRRSEPTNVEQSNGECGTTTGEALVRLKSMVLVYTNSDPARILQPMGHFEIIRNISGPELIAEGHGIQELSRLGKKYRPGRWRKLKCRAVIELEGKIWLAELHWYELHGLGRVETKVKRLLKCL
jgi:hypothetical protein